MFARPSSPKASSYIPSASQHLTTEVSSQHLSFTKDLFSTPAESHFPASVHEQNITSTHPTTASFNKLNVTEYTQHYWHDRIHITGLKWYQRILHTFSFGRLYSPPSLASCDILKGTIIRKTSEFAQLISENKIALRRSIQSAAENLAYLGEPNDLDNFLSLQNRKLKIETQLQSKPTLSLRHRRLKVSENSETKKLTQELKEVNQRLKELTQSEESQGAKIIIISLEDEKIRTTEDLYKRLRMVDLAKTNVSLINTTLKKATIVISINPVVTLATSLVGSCVALVTLPLGTILLIKEIKEQKEADITNQITNKELEAIQTKKSSGVKIDEEDRLLRAFNKAVSIKRDPNEKKIQVVARLSSIFAATASLAVAALHFSIFLGAVGAASAIVFTNPVGLALAGISILLGVGLLIYRLHKKISQHYAERFYFNLLKEAISDQDPKSDDYKTAALYLRDYKEIDEERINERIIQISIRKLIRFNPDFAAGVLLKLIKSETNPEKYPNDHDKRFTNWLKTLNKIDLPQLEKYLTTPENDINFPSIKKEIKKQIGTLVFLD